MNGPFCLLFAGQSIQVPGMCGELWKFNAAKEILERLKPSLGDDLEFITTEMPSQDLDRTFNAQRAIHAHHLGHWFAYKAMHPDIDLSGAIGHSLGVVAALVAAGAMSVEDSGVFVRARAQAFSDACRSFPEPQGLAAVIAEDISAFEEKINAFPGVSWALHNTRSRGTIGGRVADLEAFAAHAKKEGWPLKVLSLRAEGPFHTPGFSSCKSVLKTALEKIRIQEPQVPVFMGTSGKAEHDPRRIRELLADQADHRERYLDAVRSAYDTGRRSFLEVSFQPQLSIWLSDQILDPALSILAVRTEDLRA